jgi:hypothetical protein
MSPDRVEFIDGPCPGQMNYPKPPRMLIRMDDEFCYHEYERISPVGVSCARYRYRARLGKPRWAYAMGKDMFVIPQVSALT